MSDIILGILLIVISIVNLIFYKWMGVETSKFWKKWAPFSITNETYYKIGSIMGGIATFFFGVFAIILGIIKMTQ